MNVKEEDKLRLVRSLLRQISITSFGALAALIGTKVLIDYAVDHESEYALAGAACSLVMMILFVSHMRSLVRDLP